MNVMSNEEILDGVTREQAIDHIVKTGFYNYPDVYSLSDESLVVLYKANRQNITERCPHKDGWILEDGDNIVIFPENDQSTFQCVFSCNSLGCSATKVFKLDIDAWEAHNG